MADALPGTIEDAPRARAYLRYRAAARALSSEFGLRWDREDVGALVDLIANDTLVREALRSLVEVTSDGFSAPDLDDDRVRSAVTVLQDRGLLPSDVRGVSVTRVRILAHRAAKLLRLVPGIESAVRALRRVLAAGPAQSAATGTGRSLPLLGENLAAEITLRAWLGASPERMEAARAISREMSGPNPSPARVRLLLNAVGEDPLPTDYAALVQADTVARALASRVTFAQLVELVEAGTDLRAVTGRPTLAMATRDGRRSDRRLTNPRQHTARVVGGGLPGLGYGGR